MIFLADLFETLKAVGGQVKLRIEPADSELITQAIKRGGRYRSFSDCQILGYFHHFTVRDGDVEIELVTNRERDVEDAKLVAILGLQSVAEWREYQRRDVVGRALREVKESR